MSGCRVLRLGSFIQVCSRDWFQMTPGHTFCALPMPSSLLDSVHLGKRCYTEMLEARHCVDGPGVTDTWHRFRSLFLFGEHTSLKAQVSVLQCCGALLESQDSTGAEGCDGSCASRMVESQQGTRSVRLRTIDGDVCGCSHDCGGLDYAHPELVRRQQVLHTPLCHISQRYQPQRVAKLVQHTVYCRMVGG